MDNASSTGRRFEGKVALVTGAAHGIGRGIALCLAEGGADVVINDRDHLDDAAEVVTTIEKLGRQAIVLQADVSDRDAVARLFEESVRHFGRIDIAVANAGFSIREPVVEAQWEHVRSTLEVTQFGVFHTCQMAAQQMLKQERKGRSRGKIVITGSVHQELAVPSSAAYNMAKSAVNHLARTMAAELAEHQINVNVVNPGWIDTPGERKYSSEEDLQAGARRIPWRRLGVPEDIGKAVAFLASDDADYITGASLRVDGGFVLGLQLPSRDQ